jgi:hypothetical protein
MALRLRFRPVLSAGAVRMKHELAVGLAHAIPWAKANLVQSHPWPGLTAESTVAKEERAAEFDDRVPRNQRVMQDAQQFLWAASQEGPRRWASARQADMSMSRKLLGVPPHSLPPSVVDYLVRPPMAIHGLFSTEHAIALSHALAAAGLADSKTVPCTDEALSELRIFLTERTPYRLADEPRPASSGHFLSLGGVSLARRPSIVQLAIALGNAMLFNPKLRYSLGSFLGGVVEDAALSLGLIVPSKGIALAPVAKVRLARLRQQHINSVSLAEFVDLTARLSQHRVGPSIVRDLAALSAGHVCRCLQTGHATLELAERSAEACMSLVDARLCLPAAQLSLALLQWSFPRLGVPSLVAPPVKGGAPSSVGPKAPAKSKQRSLRLQTLSLPVVMEGNARPRVALVATVAACAGAGSLESLDLKHEELQHHASRHVAAWLVALGSSSGVLLGPLDPSPAGEQIATSSRHLPLLLRTIVHSRAAVFQPLSTGEPEEDEDGLSSPPSWWVNQPGGIHSRVPIVGRVAANLMPAVQAAVTHLSLSSAALASPTEAATWLDCVASLTEIAKCPRAHPDSTLQLFRNDDPMQARSGWPIALALVRAVSARADRTLPPWALPSLAELLRVSSMRRRKARPREREPTSSPLPLSSMRVLLRRISQTVGETKGGPRTSRALFQCIDPLCSALYGVARSSDLHRELCEVIAQVLGKTDDLSLVPLTERVETLVAILQATPDLEQSSVEQESVQARTAALARSVLAAMELSTCLPNTVGAGSVSLGVALHVSDPLVHPVTGMSRLAAPPSLSSRALSRVIDASRLVSRAETPAAWGESLALLRSALAVTLASQVGAFPLRGRALTALEALAVHGGFEAPMHVAMIEHVLKRHSESKNQTDRA